MSKPMIDALEPRRMLAASSLRVSSVTADNRGEILVQFSARATGIKGSAIQVYTAGADGKLYTSDDKREDIGFTYSKNKKLLRIVADIKKDTPYRLKLDGKTRIKSEADGTLLDGDFVSASRASGDGVAGGNYEMQVQRDKSKTPTVRMRTAYGTIDLKIRSDIAPISANAFLTLANKGQYDQLLITRAYDSGISLIQTGGIRLTGDGNTVAGLSETTGSEFGAETVTLSNLRGTVSFARGGSNGLASNEFFFNLADNSVLDEAGGGGPAAFTPFAEVTTSAGYDALDTILAMDKVALGSGSLNLNGDNKLVDVNNLPVKDLATVQGDNTFRPSRDGIFIERTASLSIVVSKKG